jgi:S-adenosylmethionine/arginine decarboxylase-like enzyme
MAGPFGWELVLDLFDCDEAILSDEPRLRQFVETLCDDVLEMRRYGDCIVCWFGAEDIDTEGYSVVQLIETSSIVGHLSPHRRSAYWNVFSCRPFSEEQVTEFAVRTFAAERVDARFIVRGAG